MKSDKPLFSLEGGGKTCDQWLEDAANKGLGEAQKTGISGKGKSFKLPRGEVGSIKCYWETKAASEGK